jgi:predicted DNA-binding protein (UPF0251 family)
MVRPRRHRKISFDPKAIFYKPQGIPLKNLETVELSLEECEALRLKNVEGIPQIDAAKLMNTSQSTFQRILKRAEHKICSAIIKGQAIKIIEREDF